MAQEASNTVRNLLALRPDPYMFHQANCRVVPNLWDPVSKSYRSHSLLTLWTRYVVAELRKYTSLPFLCFDHDVLAQRLIDREERDACGYAIHHKPITSKTRRVCVPLTR